MDNFESTKRRSALTIKNKSKVMFYDSNDESKSPMPSLKSRLKLVNKKLLFDSNNKIKLNIRKRHLFNTTVATNRYTERQISKLPLNIIPQAGSRHDKGIRIMDNKDPISDYTQNSFGSFNTPASTK